MSTVRYYAATIVALMAIAALYLLAQPPAEPETELAKLAGHFHFEKTALSEMPGRPHKSVRQVHPSLQRISAWISSLGAAVTLADMDGDGLANDLIHVDPRTDTVTVAPMPGTGERYKLFALDAAPLPYDANTTAPMGTLAGDFNEDGLMDVLIYYWGRTPVILLRKAGTSGGAPLSRDSFTAVELTTSGERWFSNGATQADFDGDGHVDLVIGNYFQDGAHILDAKAGGVEVLHEGKGKALNGGLKHFFLWQSAAANAVNYKRVDGLLPEDVNRGWTLAIAAADLDGDLLPEIYFGFDFGPDRLLHNRSKPGHLEFAVLEGRRDFLTPKSCVINNDSFKGMGCDFGDVNGDGIFDILVSNIATKFGLTESHFLWQSTGDVAAMRRGIAPYVHAAEKLGLARSGWGWDCKLADFDNDGVLEAVQAVGFLKGTINRWPELQALGTSNDQVIHNPKFWPNFKPGADLSGGDLSAFFVRGADHRFHDVGQFIGFAEPMVSRGVAVADVDGDGLLDFALANQWGSSYFFQNHSPQPNTFLGLRLLRHGSPVIGAVARATLPDGGKLVAQVDGGGGHSGRRSPEIHFGLGALSTNAVVSVDLRWRDSQGRPQQNTLQLKPGWHTLRAEDLETRVMAQQNNNP
ncbi:MAG TPA: VCBS repeat-containing protein [Verrucomicrobiae bacterium]|nr:VCBS repeat-containing protein [Verrucomicrobiae bacterium]